MLFAQANPANSFVGLIVSVALGLLPLAAICAQILRLACSLNNKLSGGPNAPGSVMEPNFKEAFLMTVPTMGGIIAVCYGFDLVMNAGGGGNVQAVKTISYLMAFPISLLISAAMLSMMLPASFGRALLIALYCIVVVVGTVMIVFGVIVGLAFLLGGPEAFRKK